MAKKKTWGITEDLLGGFFFFNAIKKVKTFPDFKLRNRIFSYLPVFTNERL